MVTKWARKIAGEGNGGKTASFLLMLRDARSSMNMHGDRTERQLPCELLERAAQKRNVPCGVRGFVNALEAHVSSLGSLNEQHQEASSQPEADGSAHGTARTRFEARKTHRKHTGEKFVAETLNWDRCRAGLTGKLDSVFLGGFLET